jgi:hypothetical protein
LRAKHLYGNSTVQLLSDESVNEVWLIFLGNPTITATSRVSIIHFFQVDFLISSKGSGLCQFDTLDRVNPTNYQSMDTGNSSLISPARPARPKSLKSLFSIKSESSCTVII